MPTAPISANTLVSSMRAMVFTAAFAGVWRSSTELSSSRLPLMPPFSLTSLKADRMPLYMFCPSAAAGPLKAALMPKVIRFGKTPGTPSSTGATVGTGVATSPEFGGSVAVPFSPLNGKIEQDAAMRSIEATKRVVAKLIRVRTSKTVCWPAIRSTSPCSRPR